MPLLLARRAFTLATPSTLATDLYEAADGSVIEEVIEEPLLTDNPAQDLERWFHGYLSVPLLAGLCGAKRRRFYDWLNGEGMRATTARRLYEVRSLLHPVVRELGAGAAVDWLYEPGPGGKSPYDLLLERDNQAVIRLIAPFSRSRKAPKKRRPTLIPAEVDDYEDPWDAAYEDGSVMPILEIEP